MRETGGGRESESESESVCAGKIVRSDGWGKNLHVYKCDVTEMLNTFE